MSFHYMRFTHSVTWAFVLGGRFTATVAAGRRLTSAAIHPRRSGTTSVGDSPTKEVVECREARFRDKWANQRFTRVSR